MRQRPKQTHNQKRKAAYAQLGRGGTVPGSGSVRTA